MSELEWREFTERSCGATGKHGEWIVGMQGDHWYIKLTHRTKSKLPTKEERFREDWERLREFDLFEEDKFGLKEFWFASSYISSVELMTVESLDEAIAVVNLIENLSDTIPDWGTTIAEIGFTVKENKYIKGKTLIFENVEWRLSLTVDNDEGNTGMWFRYEPSGPSWHNLAVMHYTTTAFNKENTVYYNWPTDLPPLDIMALIVAEIRRIRIAGGKRRTRYPPKELSIKSLCVE